MKSRPIFLGGGHLETILPTYLRPVRQSPYVRERISTPDDDFLDLDWRQHGSDRLVILTHGFESSSKAKYILGMSNIFEQEGFDTLAWNFRSCSSELNKQPRFYHSGETEDFELIIKHALSKERYSAIYLIGFSMGGNLILKYAGEKGDFLNPVIKKICAFSVPCSLRSSCDTLARGLSKNYGNMFLNSLKLKVKQKRDQLSPFGIDADFAQGIKTLYEFDQYATAPLHGFSSADDYYSKSSCNRFLNDIKIDTLIANAANDPFLGVECYPYEEARNNKKILLEVPRFGGHVGFYIPSLKNILWSEHRAKEFILK